MPEVSGPSDLNLEERIKRLEAENLDLKKRLESKGPSSPPRKVLRNVIAWFLIVLACLFALGGVLAGWIRTTTLDTNTFVRTVAPLVKNEAVAKAVSAEAVESLWKEYKIERRILSAFEKLPPELEFIAGPVSSGLETIAQKAAEDILKSDQFQWVWERILRTAHSSAVAVIKGKGPVEVTRQGEAVLDIGELVTEVKDQLVKMGLTFLENVSVPDVGKVTLFEAEQLGAVKTGVNILETLNWLLPLLSLLCFAGGIIVSTDRRKASMVSGIGLAIAMAVVLIALGITRVELIGKVNQANREAAEVVWSQLASGLKGVDVGLMVFGILVAAGCAVAGPYGWAVSLRAKVSQLFKNARARRKGGAAPVGAVGRFISEHTWAVRIAGIAIALLVLLLGPISVWLLITVAVVLVLYLSAVELLR